MVSVNFVIPFTRLLNHRRRIVCISESLTFFIKLSQKQHQQHVYVIFFYSTVHFYLFSHLSGSSIEIFDAIENLSRSSFI